MGERTSYEPGTFSWVELSTDDVDAAKAFYGGLFGWDARDNEVPGGGVYTMLQLDGKNVGAMATQRDEERSMGIPPHWNNYVTVADADEATARAKELGANVALEPFDVMEAGRMAVLADPVGAMFFLWQAQDQIGAQLVNEFGTLTWNELSTTDTGAAQEFYSGLFGWSFEGFDDGTYFVFNLDGKRGGGMRPQTDQETGAGVPPNWMPYFHVESADGTSSKVGESGGNVLVPPMQVPIEGGGRIAIFADPSGAAFGVWEGETDD